MTCNPEGEERQSIISYISNHPLFRVLLLFLFTYANVRKGCRAIYFNRDIGISLRHAIIFSWEEWIIQLVAPFISLNGNVSEYHLL